MDKKFGYYIFGGLLIGVLFGSLWSGNGNALLGIGFGALAGAPPQPYLRKKKRKRKINKTNILSLPL